MKKINITCVLVAAVALVGGGTYYLHGKMTEDIKPPVITMESDTVSASVEEPRSALLKGVGAVDEKDGDLSGSVLVNDIRLVRDEEKGEGFEVSYVVFDSSNNMAYATRTLDYTDYYSPRFHISAPLRFTSVSGVDIYRCVTAEDCIDGDISQRIMVDMDEAFLDANSFGTYTCNVEVSNSLGDTSVLPLEFEVYDASSTEEATRPQIQLTEYLTYVKAGEPFDPMAYLEKLKLERNTYTLLSPGTVEVTEETKTYDYGYFSGLYGYFLFKDVINISTNLDIQTPGLYYVDYSFSHPTERTRGNARLLVVVEA